MISGIKFWGMTGLYLSGFLWSVTINCPVINIFVTAQNKPSCTIICFYSSTMTHSHLSLQEAVRKAQEELAKQKEVIMAQDKELKVDTILPVDTLVFDPYLRVLTSGLALTSLTVQTIS